MKARIVFVFFLLVFVFSGCIATDTPTTLEECIIYMVETNNKDEAVVIICEDLVQEYIDNSVQGYVPDYQFESDSSIIYIDDISGKEFLQIIILIDTEDYYDGLVCEECEEYYEIINDHFNLMTEETVKVCLQMSFYANENVPTGKTPVIHKFTYGEAY